MFLELFMCLILTIIGYFWVKDPWNYWKKRGVEQVLFRDVFSFTFAMFSRKIAMVDVIKKIYDKYPNKRYSAGYNFATPKLDIRDPELIKELTVKNFDHFIDRNNVLATDLEPMWSSNLAVLGGDKWRRMRTILSPAFTSSKMRNMFVLIDKNAQQVAQHFLNKNEKTVTIEAKDVVTRFTNDVIANAVFGIECDSLEDAENEFYLNGKDLTNLSGLKTTIKFMFLLAFPKFLVRLMRIRLFPEKVSRFFDRIVKENITNREKHGIVRPDVINLLLEARKNGPKHEEDNKIPDTGFATVEETDLGKTPISGSITDEDIVAQAAVFFFAGFETVSTLMSFMSYELAVNPEIQKRLQTEIDAVFSSSEDHKLTYEKLNTMKYLDMVVSEVLRKWPSAVAIDRKCTKSYTIEPKYPDEVPVKIDEGIVIFVPIYAIHRDEKLYPEAEKFDPERFSDENKGKIHGGSYLPFGIGPRNCIGSRFALMETKALFYHILLNFNIVRVEKTQYPIQLNKVAFSLTAEKGFWIGLERRK